LKELEITEMTVKKQNFPSFASIISVVSIILYCLGFLRVELEINEHKKRLNALENVATKPSNSPDVSELITNAPKSQSYKLERNRRQGGSTKNTTQAKHTADTMLKIDKLLSEWRLQLCQSKGDTCSSGPPGPPGLPGPRGQKGSRGRRGQKGRNGNKCDKGVMGSPGKSGKQGMMGPVGPQGQPGNKGQKGETGPAGMPGAKGEPGESISAPTVAVAPAKLTVNESGSALFQCSVSGNPAPAITWSKLEKQSEIRQSADSGGKLVLQSVMGSDSGVYKCSAANILGKAQALVQLEVNVRPHVSLHPGPSYAIEGSNVSLPTCHVTGHPTPVLTWRKSSGQLPQGRVRYNNSALKILHVRKGDSNLYFCSAANLLGSVEKKTLLVVVSPPRFTVRPPIKVVAYSGDTLRLYCSATGDPQPVISWKKQGGQLPVGRSQQINGALVIRDIAAGDEGNYICVTTSAGVFNAEAVTFVEVKDSLAASYILGSLNSKYYYQLISFLTPVLQSPSRSRFVRCWHAKTDGWAASTFHTKCGNKGPTVTIIKVNNYIFGGYTDVSWSSPSPSSYASSSQSFIYSLHNINGYAPAKQQIKTAFKQYAIDRRSNYGPTFGGGHDIHISNNAASNKQSYTSCGNTYPLPPGYYSSRSSCTFYAGSYKFTPTDIEVFYETTP